MKLNALHMRFGAIAGGFVLLILFGRALLPSSKTLVSIEFGAYPEQFEGLPVEIDGKVVGKLERTGQVTRIAFPVAAGDHSVRVVHPQMECVAAKLTAKPSGKVYFLLELEDSYDAKGKATPKLVLRN